MPGLYRCRVCEGHGTIRDGTLKQFGACLDSHRFLSDGVVTVKDWGYRPYVERFR
jgi:hypothetical protein